jgi:hypothetical protein
MPRLTAINWNSFAKGEDSATGVRDLLSIPNGYHFLMDNVEPVDGRPKARYGCSKLEKQNDRGSVTWMGEYQKVNGGYIVWIDGGDLWCRSYNGVEKKIKEKWISSGVKVSSVRCGKYLIINADNDDACLVLEEEGGTLVQFNGVMNNDVTPYIEATGIFQNYSGETVLPIDGVVYHPGETNDERAANPETNPNGAFYVCQPRLLSHTWVRLPSADQYTHFGLPSGEMTNLSYGMPSAQIESYEDIIKRSRPLLVTWDARYAKAQRQAGVADNTATVATTLEPVIRYDGKGDISIKISDQIASAPDGATHIRLYLSLSAPVTNGDLSSAQQKADGLTLRWLCDIPIKAVSTGTTIYLSSYGSDYSLMGSTNLAWSTARDDMPPGGFIKFAGGRLWIGGGNGQFAVGTVGDNPGRVYYSAVMDGATDQLSRLLSFDYANDYVDTSTDESEPCVGAGLSDGNLIIFNPNSIWSLKDANPDYSPRQISNLGAKAGITEINQRIFYLSQEGPATIAGSIAELIPFKSDMTTPNTKGITDGSTGAFFRSKIVNGFWHNDSWILTDGKFNAAFLMRGNDNGTWRITPAEKISLLYQSFPKKGECIVGGGNFSFYKLMDSDAVSDGQRPFLARIYTKATATPGPDSFGEAYSVKTNCRWYDDSELKIAVISDYGRVASLYGYAEDRGTLSAAVPIPSQRGPVQQGIQNGTAGHWFQIGLEKYIRNKDTLFGEIQLEIIPRPYHYESISISDYSRPEPVLDQGYVSLEDDAIYMPPAQCITFTPIAGVYSDQLNVSLTCNPNANMYYTLDGSDPSLKSWQAVPNTNLGAWAYGALRASNGYLYMGRYLGGVYRSIDNGTTWQLVSNGNGATAEGPYWTQACEDGNGNIYYCDAQFGLSTTSFIWRSTNNGTTFVSLANSASGKAWYSCVAGTDGYLYFGQAETGSIYRTNDGWATFATVLAYNALGNNVSISLYWIYALRDSLNNIYFFRADDRSYYRKSPENDYFEQTNARCPGTSSGKIKSSAGLNGEIYYVVCEWGNTYIQKSTDQLNSSTGLVSAGQRNWLDIATGNDGTIYAYAENEGIFASSDGGASWVHIDGLPDTGIWSAMLQGNNQGQMFFGDSVTGGSIYGLSFNGALYTAPIPITDDTEIRAITLNGCTGISSSQYQIQ